MPNERSSGKQPRPEQLTISQLIASLRLAQLWAVLTIIGGLIAGAFAVGYKASAMVSAVDAQETENLRKDLADVQLKETFLALLVRYEQAKREVRSAGHDRHSNAMEALESTRTALNEFVRAHVEAEDLRLGKGEKRLATITFGDGTTWTVPQELHVVTKD